MKPKSERKMTPRKEKETDWWDEISAEEKSDIKEGLAQADRGQLVPHHKVMRYFQSVTQLEA
jgi:predicted transcriptional regulator